MATALDDLINNTDIPAHIREQIAEAAINTPVTETHETFTADGEVGEIMSGKPGLMHRHEAGVGKITLYDTETGEPREVLQYMAAKKLMQMRGGQPAFSKVPTKQWKQGAYMCYLHPQHPDREYYRSLGLDSTKDCGYPGPENGGTAPAGKLASQFDLDLHMKHKHSREWQVILNARAEREKDLERETRREEMEVMRSLAMAAAGRPERAPSVEGCAKCETLTGGPLAMHQRSHLKGA